MSTRHSPRGQVFLRKDEKLKAVIKTMPQEFSNDDFVAKFQEMYPEDWIKILNRYKAHERATRIGKPFPMAEPKKYLINIAKNYIKQSQKVLKIRLGGVRMANIKVVLADGKEKMYYNAEAYVGGGQVLYVVRRTSYGAEVSLGLLQKDEYRSWESMKA